MTSLLAIAWAGVVVAAVLRRRPATAGRVDELVTGRAAPRSRRVAPTVRLPQISTRALVLWGAALLLSAVAFPPLALMVLGVATIRPWLSARRAETRRRAAVERDVGDVVTLISLAVNSGHNLIGSLRAASAHANGPLAEAIGMAVASVDHGVRLADALEVLPESLGEVVRPVVVALTSCDRYGAALGPTLDRLASDVRTASRQRAEAAARRLPIRLLFPLVTCILPAFGLLTVAPLIAGSLRGLRL